MYWLHYNSYDTIMQLEQFDSAKGVIKGNKS
jgi:hypothetical protein